MAARVFFRYSGNLVEKTNIGVMLPSVGDLIEGISQNKVQKVVSRTYQYSPTGADDQIVVDVVDK